MVLLLAATVTITDLRFRRHTEEDSRRELETAQLRFQHEQIKHQEYLQARFLSLAREPIYLAAFRKHVKGSTRPDGSAIRTELGLMMTDEMLASDGVFFVYYAPANDGTAEDGPPIILPSARMADALNITAGCYPAIQACRTLGPVTDTVRIGDRMCDIVTIPVFDENQGQFLGGLVFAQELDWEVAQEFSIGTGGRSCTALLAGNRVIASTMPGTNNLDDDLVGRFRRLSTRAQENRDAFEKVILDRKHYYCSVGKFSSLRNDPTLGYLMFNSYEDQLKVLKETQWLLLTVSLLAIMTGSAVVWFFVYRATAPLQELRNSAEAVGRGDFSRRVAVRSQDECGQLAKAFNQMTENVQQAQRELEQTVHTLKSTQAQLVQSEKLSAVGEFVAGVAHELNNPLAAVMGFSELIKDSEADEKRRRHLDLIYQSSQRCQKIVQSLLSFARRHQPERKPVSVNRLVEDVLEMVAYQLRASNVEVARRLSSQLPLALADGHQIQQVLINLINNARQAIEGNQASGQIIITTNSGSDCIRISVQDNGPGIAPENLTRIFDPFFTTKEVGQGTGLGLSLCYGLIKEHGGNISVASQPGAGATFVIELPAASEPNQNEQPAHIREPSVNQKEGEGKVILLVDDEEMLLEMIRDDFKRHGYTVFTAGNGEAALRELHGRNIDAICSDIKMPGLNGRQLYEWIRTTKPQFTRRIIFMTGDVINESLQLFLAQENLTCLNKPFALRDLRQAVKKILQSADELYPRT